VTGAYPNRLIINWSGGGVGILEPFLGIGVPPRV